MDIQQRYDTVMQTIRQIEALGSDLSPKEVRQQIQPILEDLAKQEELFSAESFKLRPSGSGGLYELYVAPDRSLSLYASAGAGGKYQPPHDHTTWAVIAGVRGIERNQFFECLERDDKTATGKIRLTETVDVGPGQSVTLGADEFHTIAVEKGTEALHLHLYGAALDTLVDRIGFESETGGSFKRFMSKPMTFAPWITQQDFEALQADGKPLGVLSLTLGDMVLAAKGAGLLPRDRIVLIDVASETEPAAEEQIRQLHRKGYHNLAVLRPAK